MNLKIRQFEQSIIDIINGTEIPIEAKRLVLENVLHKVSAVSDNQVSKEQEELLAKINTNNKDDGSATEVMENEQDL